MLIKFRSKNWITLRYNSVSDRILDMLYTPPIWSLYLSEMKREKLSSNLSITSGFFISPDIAKMISIPNYEIGKEIKLRPLENINVDLADILMKRRSSREFNNKLKFDELSSILVYGAGKSSKDKYTGRTLRTYPSPGALYPNSIYVLVNNVDGLEKGIYYFNPDILSIYLLSSNEERIKVIYSGFMDRDMASKASVIIFLVNNILRTVLKYGELGFKLSLIEAGIIAQNIVLLATALGKKSLIYESFIDNKLENGLSINGVTQFISTTILLG
ncbi:SagB/ThcOx family dehydrogenase [Saccharolobus solfataricus]